MPLLDIHYTLQAMEQGFGLTVIVEIGTGTCTQWNCTTAISYRSLGETELGNTTRRL